MSGFNIVKLTDPIQFTNVAGGLVPRGAYNAATDYAVGDSVDYNGSSYVMHTNAGAGTIPTNTTYWQVLASKGDAGPAGPTGPPVSDGDKGDITVSSSGTVWTIDNQAVTRNKLEHIQTQHFLGRHASGTSDVQEVSPAQARTMLDFASTARAETEAELIAGTNITITPAGSGAARTLTIDASGGTASGYFVLASSYGAVGNGSTDDTSALQSALNDLNTQGYGALDLEGKTYATGKLSVYPNTGIINGSLKLKNSANDYVVSFVRSATRYNERWFLDNIIIDCNKANNATTSGGVYIYADTDNFDRPLLLNVKISNFKTCGVYMGDDNTAKMIQPRLMHVTIDGNDLTSGSKGIYMSNYVYDASLMSVDVGRSDIGIDMDGSAKIRFTDVRVWGCGGVGLKLTNVVDLQAVNYEADKNFGHGVYAYNSTRVRFTGSAFSNNSYEDTSNEFGFGAGYGTPNSYDGLVADTNSDVYINGGTFMNEGTAYQRYGVSSQNSSTINFDGQVIFDGMATAETTGNVVNGKNIYEIDFDNDFKFQVQNSTRTNIGFASNVGAGMEVYKQTDATDPGKYKFIYGGGASGSVDFIYSDGTGGFTATHSVDKDGNASFAGDVTVADEVYGTGWNGSLEVPTKNAIYDKIESLGGGSPGGSANELQYNDGAGGFAGAANVEVDTGNLKLVSTTDPAAPTGGLLLYSKSVAGRHMPKVIGPSGIDTILQVGLHGNSVAMFAPANATTAPQQWGLVLTTAATISHQQTIASANPWQATRRTRFQCSTTAGNTSGARTAYARWFRGNAAGFGGFFFRAQIGQNLNLNGGQKFVGLCASTGALAATAGAVSALINMCGMGYDTTDADTGNWFFLRNDGSGTATKVDLGANAVRNTTHGYDLIMFMTPNGSELFVRITNLHSGVVVLDTSYTTDLPAVNVGMAFKCEVNNGAVAAANNIEIAKLYIESDY